MDRNEDLNKLKTMKWKNNTSYFLDFQENEVWTCWPVFLKLFWLSLTFSKGFRAKITPELSWFYLSIVSSFYCSAQFDFEPSQLSRVNSVIEKRKHYHNKLSRLDNASRLAFSKLSKCTEVRKSYSSSENSLDLAVLTY